MTDTVTLKLCPNPWCTSHGALDREIRAAQEPILMPSWGSDEWAVACPVCPLQTPWFDTESEAIAAWNTRGEGADVDGIAKIIDPDAWHEMLPTDGCGAYWIGRRNKAREQAKVIIATLTVPDPRDREQNKAVADAVAAEKAARS